MKKYRKLTRYIGYITLFLSYVSAKDKRRKRISDLEG